MTECQSAGSSRPVFGRLGRQTVDVDFNGGTITTDGGLLLLREVDRRLGLIDRICRSRVDTWTVANVRSNPMPTERLTPSSRFGASDGPE